MTPSTGAFTDGALVVNQSYTDSIYNIVIAYSSNPVDDNLSLDTFIICFYNDVG